MHSHKQDLVATSIIEMSQSFWDRENIYFFVQNIRESWSNKIDVFNPNF
jgi:hypothetical protein